jgi:hypothetical protein
MVIETSIFRALSIFVLTVTRQGDEEHFVHLRVLTQASGDLVTIHLRQTDIEDNDLRPESAGCLECSFSLVRRTNVMSPKLKQQSQGLRCIGIIVDYQNPKSSGATRRRNNSRRQLHLMH